MARQTLYQPQGVAPAGQQYAELANVLERWKQRTAAEQEAAAKERGFRKGRAEGYKVELTLPDGNSISEKAYREGANVSHAAAVKLDIAENLARIEGEAGGDPEKFQSMVDGYTEGLVTGTTPEVAPIAQAEIFEKTQKALHKMELARLQKARDEQKAYVSAGLEDLERESLNAAEEGDEQALSASMAKYDALLQGGMTAGLIPTEDGLKMQKEHTKSLRQAVDTGGFQRALDEGRGTEYMESFLKEKDETYTPEEREQQLGKWIAMTNRRHAMYTAEVKLDDETRKMTYENTKREAVSRMFDGTLSNQWLAEQNRAGNLPPDYAEKASHWVGKGPEGDDAAVKLEYSLDLMDFSEDDIVSDQRLTHKTKLALIEERRKLVEDTENWRNKPNGREAVRRIKAEFGMVDGLIAQLDPEKAKRAGRVLSELYDTVESLPLEQRPQKALNVANTLINEIKEEDRQEELARARARLEAMPAQSLEELESLKDEYGGNQYRTLKRQLESQLRTIQRLEKK